MEGSLVLVGWSGVGGSIAPAGGGGWWGRGGGLLGGGGGVLLGGSVPMLHAAIVASTCSHTANGGPTICLRAAPWSAAPGQLHRGSSGVQRQSVDLLSSGRMHLQHVTVRDKRNHRCLLAGMSRPQTLAM